MRNLLLLTLAAAALVPSLAAAQSDLKGISIGGTVGTFMPSGGTLRDVFGADRFTLGFRPIAPKEISSRWLPDFGFDAISAERGDNKLAIFPFTIGVVRRFGGKQDLVRPYARVGIGAAYMDYAFDDRNGKRISAKRLAPAGNVEVGLNIAGRAKLAATYHVFPEYSKTSFNGLELSFSYSLFTF